MLMGQSSIPRASGFYNLGLSSWSASVSQGEFIRAGGATAKVIRLQIPVDGAGAMRDFHQSPDLFAPSRLLMFSRQIWERIIGRSWVIVGGTGFDTLFQRHSGAALVLSSGRTCEVRPVRPVYAGQ